MAEESAGLFWLPDCGRRGAGSTGGGVLAKQIIALCRVAALNASSWRQGPGAYDNSVAQRARGGRCPVGVACQRSRVQGQHTAIGGRSDRQVESAIDSVG